MKRQLGLLSVVGVILFMAMTVFAGDVYLNDTKWGTYTGIALDANGKLVVTGTPDSTPTPTGNTIKGKITNNTHFTTPAFAPISIGIPGVTVNLTGPATKSTTTGADGTYQFTGLANGDGYTVTPSKANYLFTPENLSFNFSSAGGNETVSNADFAAEAVADYTITGTVFDKVTPTPGVLSGVTLELRLGSTLVDSTTTGSGGTYTFIELLSGFTYRVTIVPGTKTFNIAYYDVLISSGNVSGKNFIEVAPPTIGQFTEAINKANLCNQPIRNPDGSATSYGKGFYNYLDPPGVYISRGDKVYFLIDSAWMGTFGTPKVRWIMYDQKLAGFKMNIYAVDTKDNGTLLLATEVVTNVFSIPKKTGIRYLLEVDATNASDGFNFTVYWP